MTDIPILFSAPMVRALLDGRKTMTRRLAWNLAGVGPEFPGKPARWQRVKPGDRLWVRERTMCVGVRDGEIKVSYDADDFTPEVWLPFPDRLKFNPKVGKRLSMGCYREASRLTLIVETVKIERLQDISEADAIAEGVLSWRDDWSQKQAAEMLLRGTEASVETGAGSPAVRLFYLLWTSLHGREGWKANPEIVAISFRVIKSNIDSAEARAAQF